MKSKVLFLGGWRGERGHKGVGFFKSKNTLVMNDMLVF